MEQAGGIGHEAAEAVEGDGRGQGGRGWSAGVEEESVEGEEGGCTVGRRDGACRRTK